MVLKTRYFLLIGFAVALFSCGDGAKRQGPIDAKALYNQKCSLCHGNDGKLMLAQASDLSKSVLSVEERMNIISNGKNTMAPFKAVLSQEEIKAVAIYLETFRTP